MKPWLVIILASLITYGLRFSFIALVGRIEFAPWVARALRFVPAAVLSALVFPLLLYQQGVMQMPWQGNDRILAGAVAVFFAWRSKNLFLTLVVGMVTLWVLQWLRGMAFALAW